MRSTATAPNRLIEAARSHIAHVQPTGKGWSDEEQTALPTALPPDSRSRRRGRPCPRRRGLHKQQLERTASVPARAAPALAAPVRPGDHQHRLRAAGGQQPVQHKEWLEDVAASRRPTRTSPSTASTTTRARSPPPSPRCCGPEPSPTSSTPTSPTCRRF